MATGYIQVSAYTGKARIPLSDVSVAVTATDGTVLAMRLTDRSGRIDPIEIPVPSLQSGQTPNTGTIPFTSVNLYARADSYTQITVENLQVFADTVTDQNLELIPLSEFPASWGKTEVFLTPSQNL